VQKFEKNIHYISKFLYNTHFNYIIINVKIQILNSLYLKLPLSSWFFIRTDICNIIRCKWPKKSPSAINTANFTIMVLNSNQLKHYEDINVFHRSVKVDVLYKIKKNFLKLKLILHCTFVVQ